MTREELMKKCYSIAVEMGLGAINEKDFNKIMWTGVADEEIEEYYRFLWRDYDDWVYNHYNASEVLVIDMDKMDIVNNESDKELMIKMVKEKLEEIRK